ncbi:nitroreductase, partial [Staphylococcus pseudintermedius]
GGTDDFKVEEMLKIDGNHESIVDCVFITKDREAVF